MIKKHLYEYNYDMPEASGIYCILNNVNNKCYIGQAVYLPCRAVLLYHEHNLPLQNAYKKYGMENFSVELVEVCDRSILNEREIYWIKELHTYVGDSECHGYNLTTGGDGVLGYKYTPEQIENNRAAQLKVSEQKSKKLIEYYSYPEHRQKTSESTKLGMQDPKLLEHLSESRKLFMNLPASKEFYSGMMSDLNRRDDVKIKQLESRQKIFDSPEFKDKHSETMRLALSDPAYKEKASEISKANWQDEEFRKKQSASRIGQVWINNGTHQTRVKPDKLELMISLGYVLGRLK